MLLSIAGKSRVEVPGWHGRGAEMDELGGVVAQPLGVAEQRVEQRLEDRAVLQRADHRAVLRSHVVDVRGRSIAPRSRHVAHHHRGIAGNVPGHMPGEQPRVDVVTTAGGGADDDGDLLSPVELGNGLLGGRAIDRHGGYDHGACKTAPHRVLRRVRSAWWPRRVSRTVQRG
jgi:hypothetical protein